ncbi:MAG: glycosyltransferase [Opitutae bacterium]
MKQNQSIELVHVIDQSYSPYLKIVKQSSPATRLLTCHDLIAIRTARGDFPNAPKTSATGKRLQKWIQYSLPLADFYACDSDETQNDLNHIVPQSSNFSRVIHLGTQRNSAKSSNPKSLDPNLCFDPSEINYLLHVGSAAWYKNRTAVLKSFFHSKNQPNGKNLKLILVGPPPQRHEINAELSSALKRNSSDVICLVNISRETLIHLYLHAKLLLFPSFIEGFGWPPLEAASRGCSVITTKTGAIYDLLGDNAKYVDPGVQDSINKAVTDELQQRSDKDVQVSLPNKQQCRENYYKLYRQLLKN